MFYTVGNLGERANMSGAPTVTVTFLFTNIEDFMEE